MKKTGQRIRDLRLELNLSQSNLAEQIGVAQNTITQYEKGTTKTSIEIIVRLAVSLNTTTDYLLGLIDD